ncbi:helix-turn-helix transcriptional regulator [Gordonia alkaliphila]|uniref:HTH luxR-type domain-containing protein n=1 Tax=Gordonia alkaliphila TaxID=1053547 RepID=A0ABP8Z3T4_9ACTN
MQRSESSTLPSREYDAIFAVLDDCAQAASLPEFKNLLMDALHRRYRFPNTTFLTGATFRGAFRDPHPVTTGRITPIIDEYTAGWYADDMFATPQSYAALARNRAICHTSLRELPTEAVTYLDRFLYRHRLKSASVLHLALAGRSHAMVGIFDDEDKSVPPERLAGLGLLARQLSTFAQTLPGHDAPSWRSALTPRQAQIGELVADGQTNEEIAATLCIGLDTVKKHVSAVLAATKTRNRVEFAKLVLTEELARA